MNRLRLLRNPWKGKRDVCKCLPERDSSSFRSRILGGLSHKKWICRIFDGDKSKVRCEKLKILPCLPIPTETPRRNTNNASNRQGSLISHLSVPPCPWRNERDGFGNVVGTSTRRAQWSLAEFAIGCGLQKVKTHHMLLLESTFPGEGTVLRCLQ